jgi:hypothetical protein
MTTMRSKRSILRQIFEQKLDPAVPYVPGKGGMLVPKRNYTTSSSQEETKEEAKAVSKVFEEKREEVQSAPVAPEPVSLPDPEPVLAVLHQDEQKIETEAVVEAVKTEEVVSADPVELVEDLSKKKKPIKKKTSTDE